MIDPLISEPAGFARKVLGLSLYWWQEDVLNWFRNTTKLIKGSLCTPNGAGKSERIVATLALWWITVHPKGIVVITTKDSKQLDNQIWPAIERFKGKFGGYDFIERMVRNGTGGFVIGFTTDDPGRAEGWHKLDDFDGPLLVIGDEAKSIPDPIHMALDRCTYNAKLLTSSPGLTEGLFYRSQTDKTLGFRSLRIGLVDCPHIPQSRIDNIIQTYGPDHWFTRSTLYAEFTDADSDTLFVIPKHVVRSLMESPPRYVHGGHRAFCDFAAGRNENVFAYKRGNKITLTCWKDPDPMRAVGRFIQLFVEHDLMPSEIWGDEGGMGIPILARFREMNWPINACNNNAPAVDSVRYPNLGAEMWYNAAIGFGKQAVILEDDPVLFEQLTTRRAAPTSEGLLGLETKKEMQKRGVPSPDRADAVVGVMAADAELAPTLFDETGLNKLEGEARGTQPESGALDLTGDTVSYERNAQNAWLRVWERPVIGRSYICVLSPARHSEPMTDHSLIVVRMGFTDEEQDKEVPTRLVAKVRRPLRLDAGPLSRMVKNLSAWYGQCLVVPVVNDRGDVIDKLSAAGLQLYVREQAEVINHGRRERMVFGWETDDYTRSQWIGSLAEVIRDDKLKVEDNDTVTQLYQLTSENAERMRDAEAIGVAVQLINYSTQYVAPERESVFNAEQWRSASLTLESMIS